MRVTIDIPDGLYADLKKRCKEPRPSKAEVNDRIREVLKEFNAVGADGQRYFLVAGKERQQLERVFQTTISSAEELAKRVEILSQVGIGDAVRALGPGESIQLTEQAQFWGQTPKEYIENTVNRVMDEVLNRV